jgi:hypothetical protein
VHGTFVPKNFNVTHFTSLHLKKNHLSCNIIPISVIPKMTLSNERSFKMPNGALSPPQKKIKQATLDTF